MNNFLENQYILYILCFLGITNLLGFLYVKDYDSMVLLVALGIVTSYFSENHIIQISVALIGTNFIFVNKKVSEGFKAQRRKVIKEKFKGNKRRRVKEGFKKEEEEEEEEEGEKEKKKGEGEQEKYTGNSNKCDKKGYQMKDCEKEKIEQFSNKKKIDQSATLKDAYSNISNVLGKGGLNNLTKETQELVSQQKDLIKQMSSLAPMIANVSSLAKNMPDMNNMGNLLKGLGK